MAMPKNQQNLTDQEAIELFRIFRNEPLIMAGGIQEGCDTRATLMVLDMQKRGYDAGKAWCWSEIPSARRSKEKDSCVLFLPSQDSSGKIEGFNYHVAPFVQRRDGKQLVFDPVLYDAPVTLEQWYQNFGAVKGATKHLTLTSPLITIFNVAVMKFNEAASDRATIVSEAVHRRLMKDAVGEQFVLMMRNDPCVRLPLARSDWARAHGVAPV